MDDQWAIASRGASLLAVEADSKLTTIADAQSPNFSITPCQAPAILIRRVIVGECWRYSCVFMCFCSLHQVIHWASSIGREMCTLITNDTVASSLGGVSSVEAGFMFTHSIEIDLEDFGPVIELC